VSARLRPADVCGSTVNRRSGPLAANPICWVAAPHKVAPFPKRTLSMRDQQYHFGLQVADGDTP
jgi:hypothetical protein